MPSSAARASFRLLEGVRYWVVIGFLVLGFCGASVLMLVELRRDSWTLAETGAQNLLTVLAQDIQTNITAYDRVLAGVVAKLEDVEFAQLTPPVQQSLLFDHALVEPFFTSLLVLDRDGNVVRNAGAVPPRRDNFADRAYFQAFATGTAKGLFISPPFKRRLTRDDEVLGLARRINAPDGSFSGVVVGTLRLADFRQMFERARLNPGDAINLFSQSGILVMRNPYQASQIGRDMSGTANVRRFQAEASGTFTGISAIDGVQRVYNFAHVGDLPLILNVALAHDAIFAAWRTQAMTIGVILCFLCALAATLGLVGRREFLRRSRAEAVMRESEAQYRLLASHATDVILRLDRDLVRRYVSPAAQTMLGFAPAELLGRKTRELIHADDWSLVEGLVRDTRESRTPNEAVYRIRHRSGRHVWVEGRYNYVAEDDGFIVVLRDITRRKSAELELASAHAELARRADTDGLTSLANRRCFDEALAAACAWTVQAKQAVSLLLIDVDRFKLFNDGHGHPAGDECLRQVAAAIAGAVRPGDLAARYGGEELAVILADTTESDACRIGERIREAVARLGIEHASSEAGHVTVSIGCATLESETNGTADELVGAADRMLYEAKRTGRDKVLSPALLAATPVLPRQADEAHRLAAVATSRKALEARAPSALDAVTAEAARLLNAPVGFVSLVGESDVTLIGRHGTDITSVPRDISFCTHTIGGSEPLVVGDALADVRFRDSPLVRGEDGIRFYAGAPLVDPDSGMTVGAVCVADVDPHQSAGPAERELLKRLSDVAVKEIADR